MKKIANKVFEDRLNFASLTDEERETIRKQAYEQVQEERKTREQEAYLVVALRDARRQLEPDAEMVDFFVDLPGHAVRILIDGVEYIHGFTYEVTKQQYATMAEIVQRAWDHEDEVGGANRHFYQKPRNQTLTRRHMNVTTRNLAAV